MATGDRVVDDKARIEASIKAFRSGSLAKNAGNFFDALGYSSERTEDLESNTPEGLLELVNRPDFFNRGKARPEEWASINLLFQLTDDEVRDHGQTSLDFDSKQLDMDSDRRFYSYLFFVVQLKKDSYNRTILADITREINRFFDMPALVLFKHGRTLTLSIIDRRLHKRDEGRDVLKKVTLIKDIRVESPHRAHVEILFDLAFPQLLAEHRVTNFVELHDAWRKTLDISELNRRFYKDLANWYFWALEQVKFPAQPDVTDEVNRATNVIRLITRLTFVWFLKERQLVPDDLFRRETLESVLTDLSPRSSTFYKAILQNLFFATLNTPMSDAENPREFRTDTEGKRYNDQYMVHNQYRHKKLFSNPEAALEMFASVPFLNGGLFECLDKREEVNGKLVETRVDGFSDLEKKQPTVPNRLFFCEEHSCADDGVDLNTVYGTRNKQYKVRGLIDTLNRYKFTIDENTPLDEEVALDPELLGKVFENLLASYNPETGATARKQTGSFYTPREIVNYMVDESLIAYLETRLRPAGSDGQSKSTVMRERDAQASFIGQQPLMVAEAEAATRGEQSDSESLNFRLRQLFAYTDKPHGFSEGEVEKLIRAIDEVKILDPACGSGAYPMGILGKLVFILTKLDPLNARWKQRQIDRVGEAMRAAEKIEDAKFRESTLQDLRAQVGSIEEAFRNNELDYGRKLFLIENCIYGVDIQPIAIQISKLRFFISLIIDQKIRAQAENLGIRPLPNLETKFVAANTLLGIEKPAQSMLQNEDLRQAIEEKERELKSVRERHFTARTTRTKEKYRKEDERLRREIGKLLEEDNWSPETTAKLIRWNPYDQNTSAEFFDAEWMFGVSDNFDIVIGNPPYGTDFSAEMKKFIQENYKSYKYKYDSYIYFIEKAFNITRRGGSVIYITPQVWLKLESCFPLRRLIAEKAGFEKVKLFGESVFSEAVVNTVVPLFRIGSSSKTLTIEEDDSSWQMQTKEWYEAENMVIEYRLKPDVRLLIKKIRSLNCDPLSNLGEVIQGITPYDKYKGQSSELIKRRGYHFSYKHDDTCGKWLDGSDVSRYRLRWGSEWLSYGPWLGAPREPRFFEGQRLLFREIPGENKRIQATIAEETYYHGHSITPFKLYSKSYDLRFLLGVVNSELISWYARLTLPNFGKDIFPKLNPQDIKALPIAPSTQKQQAPISKLVDQVLAAKRKDSDADTSELEREIDRLVYQLYNLTPDEIDIVEASARG
jgi:type I restriction-modification system DNA methylase subunit